MDFGTALKEERKKVKLTQQALADLIGMSRTYLSDVENNRYNPSVDFIKKVSTALTNTSKNPELKVTSIFNKLMTAAAYSLPNEDFKRNVYDVFIETEKEIINRYPLLESDRFKSFFNNIDDFRDLAYQDIEKIGINDPEMMREFYLYRLGKNLPLNDSPDDFNVKAYLLNEAGYYQEGKIPLNEKIKEIVINHPFEEVDNKYHEKALENTINTFNDVDFEPDRIDVMSVYLSNIAFYKGDDRLCINNKNSYTDFLTQNLKSMEEFKKNIETEMLKKGSDIDTYSSLRLHNELTMERYKRLLELLKD